MKRIIKSMKNLLFLGFGGIIIVEVEDIPSFLQKLENYLRAEGVTPYTYTPRTWLEGIRNVWYQNHENPNWGVAVYIIDDDTPEEIYSGIDFNRDMFFDSTLSLLCK